MWNVECGIVVRWGWLRIAVGHLVLRFAFERGVVGGCCDKIRMVAGEGLESEETQVEETF